MEAPNELERERTAHKETRDEVATTKDKLHQTESELTKAGKDLTSLRADLATTKEKLQKLDCELTRTRNELLKPRQNYANAAEGTDESRRQSRRCQPKRVQLSTREPVPRTSAPTS